MKSALCSNLAKVRVVDQAIAHRDAGEEVPVGGTGALIGHQIFDVGGQGVGGQFFHAGDRVVQQAQEVAGVEVQPEIVRIDFAEQLQDLIRGEIDVVFDRQLDAVIFRRPGRPA